MSTAPWMAESPSHLHGTIKHRSCTLPAPLLWGLSHKPLPHARPDSQHPHHDGDASKRPCMAVCGLRTWEKKRYTGADTFAGGVIPAASSLLAVPLHCHRLEKEAGCSLSGSCASRICARDLTAPLWGDPFDHSEIQLVTLAGCQKVCKAKVHLGTACHCHQQVLEAQTGCPGPIDGATAS